MKKQVLVVGLALSLLFSGSLTLANIEDKDIENQEVEAELIMNMDNILDLTNVETYEKDGTTMVALRKVAEGILGLDVKWIGETRTVEIGSGPQWTSITIGKNAYFHQRVAHFPLSQAPELKNSTTYVPIEFFTEVLNYQIRPEEMILSGFLKDIVKTDKLTSILVAGDEDSKFQDEVMFHISEDTIIEDKDGKGFKLEDLRIGNKLEVLIPEILTLSIPPQGTAERIKVLNTDVFIVENKAKDNENVLYPALEGLDKSEEINLKIREFVQDLEAAELYKKLELDYEVSFLNDEILSLIFTGKFHFYEAEKSFVKSLNLDLENAKEINFENFFKEDKESQIKLLEIIEEASKEQHDIEFEAEGKEIYFKGSNLVVFYYPLDDSVVDPLYIYLPLEELEGLY